MLILALCMRWDSKTFFPAISHLRSRGTEPQACPILPIIGMEMRPLLITRWLCLTPGISERGCGRDIQGKTFRNSMRYLAIVLLLAAAGFAPSQPQLSLKDMQGQQHNLSDYHGKIV